MLPLLRLCSKFALEHEPRRNYSFVCCFSNHNFQSLCSALYRNNPVPFLQCALHVKRISTYNLKTRKTSYYEVLGIKRSATQEEIRNAYLSLSKKYHPDTNTSDTSMHKTFVEINEAYSTLSKPLSKRDYDLTLDADKHFHRHMRNAEPKAQDSQRYGYSKEPGTGFHYQGNMYGDTEWERHEVKARKGLRQLIRNYSYYLTTALVLVFLITQYMESIPDASSLLLRRFTPLEMEKFELVMISDQEGEIIYYYAIPTESNSKEYNITSFRKEVINKETGDYVMKQLQQTRDLSNAMKQLQKTRDLPTAMKQLQETRDASK